MAPLTPGTPVPFLLPPPTASRTAQPLQQTVQNLALNPTFQQNTYVHTQRFGYIARSANAAPRTPKTPRRTAKSRSPAPAIKLPAPEAPPALPAPTIDDYGQFESAAFESAPFESATYEEEATAEQPQDLRQQLPDSQVPGQPSKPQSVDHQQEKQSSHLASSETKPPQGTTSEQPQDRLQQLPDSQVPAMVRLSRHHSHLPDHRQRPLPAKSRSHVRPQQQQLPSFKLTSATRTTSEETVRVVDDLPLRRRLP